MDLKQNNELLEKYKSFKSYRTIGSQRLNRIDFVSEWIKNALFYYNILWVAYKNGGWLDYTSSPPFSKLFKIFARDNDIPEDVNNLLGFYKSYKPKRLVLPRSAERDDIDKAIYSQRLLDAVYDMYGYEHVRSMFLLKWVLFGTAGIFAGYVDDETNPAGGYKFKFKAYTPFEFIINPTVEDYEDHKEIFLIHDLDTDYVRHRWGVEATNENDITTLQSLFFPKENRVVVLEYFSKPDYLYPDGRHLFMLTNGTVLWEDEDGNPYGDRLPIVFVPYFPIPNYAYGLSPIFLARKMQMYRNILWSVILNNTMKFGFFILAPEGSFKNKDIEIYNGAIVEYLGMGNQAPKVVQVSSIDSSMSSLIQEFTSRYRRKMQVMPIEYGEAPASASGKARELQLKGAEMLKTPQFEPLEFLEKQLAIHVLKTIQEDKYAYFSDKEFLLGEKYNPQIIHYKKEKITFKDIKAEVKSNMPYDENALMGIVIQNAFARVLKDKNDMEARDIVNEVMERVGLDYLVKNRDIHVRLATYENQKMIELLQKYKKDWQELSDKQQNEIFEYIEKYFRVEHPHDHKTHIQYHDLIINSPEFLEYPNWLKVAFIVHRDAHMEKMGGAWSQPGSELQKQFQKLIAPIVQPRMRTQIPTQNMGGEMNAWQGEAPENR